MASLAGYTSVFRVRLGDGNVDGNGNSRGRGGRQRAQQIGNSETPQNGIGRVPSRSIRASTVASAGRVQARARARPVVSCQLCRARKQKCDRLLPCGTCRRRGDKALCRYGGEGVAGAAGEGPDGRSQSGGRGVAGVRQETQVRLQKLERLVNGMVARSGTEDGGGSGGFEAAVAGSARRRRSNTARGAAAAAAEAASEALAAASAAATSEAGCDYFFRTAEEGSQTQQQQQQNAFPVAGMIGEVPGATNWAAVLDGIRDIQSYLGKEAEGGSDGSGSETDSARTQTRPAMLEEAEPDVIFAAGRARPLTVAEAVAELPGRHECDRLLAEYFQTRFVTQPFLHAGQFQRAYARFWAMGGRTTTAPSASGGPSFLWLSMLASTLSVAATITGTRQANWLPERDRGGDNGDDGDDGDDEGAVAAREPNNADLELAGRLRRLSTRCLLAGDYLSARPLAVEALLLNASTRLMQRRDADAALWGTFCVATRLAQRMGYQQVDGGGGSGSLLTPFEREMRRRVWYVVEAYDMLYSFQFGMPAIVHEDDTATELPHNLRDDDFDEASAVLPPARPSTDASMALFCAVKLRLVRLLRRVVRFSMRGAGRQDWQDRHGTGTTPEFLAAELHLAHSSLPGHLRMPPRIRDCPFTDASHDIMHRLVLDLIHHKAVCVLFRQALTRDSSSGSSGVSSGGSSNTDSTRQARRRACLVSALRILDLHVDFERETRPTSTAPAGTGRLATERHMFGSIALHDFLLAATILCLDLIEGGEHNGRQDGHTADDEPSLEQRATDRNAKLAALRGAYALWHDRRLTSRDAAHAARVLGAIVRKLEEEGGAAATTTTTTTTTSENVTDTGTTATETTTTPSFHRPPNVTYDWSDPGPFDAVLSDPYNLDWYAIDSFLLDRQPEADAGGMLWSADLMALEN